MATDTVFIYTMNQGIQGGAWSRYVFPWTIEHFSHLENTLYMRHADIVSFVVESALDDDGNNFNGVIQWPWLDFGKPGVEKQLLAFDISGVGVSSIEIGYDQNNLSSFTTPFTIPADTYPGEVIDFPILAPSISVKLTYTGGVAWQWNTLNLHMQSLELGT